MTLVTVPNYPLVKVGMWSASTGQKAVTKEDLEAIVEAHESNLLDKGVIKKGHLDPRHTNPTWDGDPVYGQVDNLRLSDDGLTLMGDYVNVPKELADSLPSAYPNRSVEIAWGVQLHDVAGKVTKKFKAALAGVALLGRTPPAVKGLGGPQVSALSAGSVECDSVAFYSTTDFSLPGGLTANALRTALDKAIGDAYKKPSTAAGFDGDYPWMTDYDDETAWFRLNAGTFQVSYTADAQGNITLADDVVEVVERRTFVPVNDTPAVPQTNLSEKEAKDVPGTPRADTSNEEEPPMSEVLKKLRDKLGLPETATEEEILAAAAEADLTPKADEAPKETPAAAPASATGVTVETGTSASEGGKHAAPADDSAPKTIAVSAVAFSELMETNRANSAKLADLEAKDKAARVETLVTQFSTAGKIHPTEVGYFREQLAANEAPTVAFLSERTGIPVSEIGSENATVAHFSDDAYGAAASYFNLEGK